MEVVMSVVLYLLKSKNCRPFGNNFGQDNADKTVISLLRLMRCSQVLCKPCNKQCHIPRFEITSCFHAGRRVSG